MADFAQELTLHIPRLRRYARALTHNVAWADDLVQDTLERAMRRRWLFRLNSNLTAWLLTMLHRLYLNDLARQRSTDSMTAAAEDAAISHDPGLRLDMQQALLRISAEHRAVILLVGLEQLTYQEAADVLGIPVGTVMSRLARARGHLQQLLSGQPAGHKSSAHLSRIK
ncbi:MAG: sigma-70 family RNA polymerase sigma factor [Proteobacteria bacterium]|nr:sigma-70 family RNA polymerase sigma factor [Pseudomonadota bacterium]